MSTVVSFGGGVNSTALLLGLHERDQCPDHILFADTGGEKPSTYKHVAEFSAWLLAHGFPAITTVREARFTLEEECLKAQTMPSIVLGMRSCSDKFKIRPQNRFLVANKLIPCIKLVGFDADEAHRIKNYDDARFTVRYPLVDWGWGRDECIEAIARHGLGVPPKSSCFFCPEMQAQEIAELRKESPDLLERALRMEAGNVKMRTAKGLARSMSWKQILVHIDAGEIDKIPKRVKRMPCMCFDGET